MSGTWVFVCGPSGAGKDSVIQAARQQLREHGDIVFARRLVTRPEHAADEHDPASDDEFRALRERGGLRWHWQAHGFCYGITQAYEAEVRSGRLVVVNGSRAHVKALAPAADVRTVLLTTDADQLADRLQQRGRDGPEALARRMARNAEFSGWQADCLIVNNSDLASAAHQLAHFLVHSLAHHLDVPRDR